MQNLPYKIRRSLWNYSQLYIKSATPVAVFCTGRVGSIALFNTLEAVGVFAFKIEHLADAEKRNQLGNSRWFYRHILQARRPAKIISIARDPIALCISDFFNKLHWITGEQAAWQTHSIAELVTIFNTRYFADGRHLNHLAWWDSEFKASLGIDVYAHPSPAEAGWGRFQHAPYDVLLLRLEMDNALKSQVVGDFVDVPDLTITYTNVGDQKAFGAEYKAFKEQVVVDPLHLDSVYDAPYARHFYTHQEIATFREKWSGQDHG